MIRFDNHMCLYKSERSKVIFTEFSHTLALFWLTKTYVIIETYQLSFRVFMYTFHPEISKNVHCVNVDL